MQKILLTLAGVLLGLAAGWFIRGAQEKPAEKPARIPAAVPTETAKAPVPVAANGLATAWTGSANSGGPAPFTSLEELISIIDSLDMDDELGYVEMFTGVPRLMCTDLAATRRLLAELEGSERPKGESRGILAFSLLARWMMQEPEGAIEFAKVHPGIFGSSGNMMASGIPQEFASMGIMMLAKKNPAAARAMVETLPKDDQEEALEMLKTIESMHDPEGALKALPADGSGDPEPIVGRWARKDPEAALRWINSRDEDEREDLLAAVAEGWAKKDWKAAAQWAAGLPAEVDRAGVYSKIIDSFDTDTTPAQAAADLAGLPQALADRALLALEQHSGKSEESAAAAARVLEILKRNAGDEAFQSGAGSAVDSMARTLAAGEGKSAADWAMSLPPGPAQTSAISTVTSEWAEHEPVEASAWVTSLPAGELREKAATQLIEKIAGNDPQHAFEWAKSLTDEEERTGQMGKVLRQWLPKDPFSAMKAVESLPADVRAEIWSKEEQ
ncbi:MAG TPA: hypothetical protein VHM91_07795 [Verrucomicrobiales bacterium]|nr:hypothetical protein [Verrucomicrobiales bacterium]